jgi:hypothetical protein
MCSLCQKALTEGKKALPVNVDGAVHQCWSSDGVDESRFFIGGVEGFEGCDFCLEFGHWHACWVKADFLGSIHQDLIGCAATCLEVRDRSGSVAQLGGFGESFLKFSL